MGSHVLSNTDCSRCTRKLGVENTEPNGLCALCQRDLGRDPKEPRYAEWLKTRERVVRCIGCEKNVVAVLPRTDNPDDLAPGLRRCHRCTALAENLVKARKAKAKKAEEKKNGKHRIKPILKVNGTNAARPLPASVLQMNHDQLVSAAWELARRYRELKKAVLLLGMKP